MPRFILRIQFLLLFSLASLTHAQQATTPQAPIPDEGDFMLHDFHFKSGEVLPQVRMHYYTFGKPAKDSSGKTTNAVLILHGTSGSGRQFQTAGRSRWCHGGSGPHSLSCRWSLSLACRKCNSAFGL